MARVNIRSSKNPFCSYCKQNGHWMRDRFKNVTLCPILKEKERRYRENKFQNTKSFKIIKNKNKNKNKNKFKNSKTLVTKSVTSYLKPENIFTLFGEIENVKSTNTFKNEEFPQLAKSSPNQAKQANQANQAKQTNHANHATWVQIATAPAPAPAPAPKPSQISITPNIKFLKKKQHSPRRVEQLKEETRKDKLPIPYFLKSIVIPKQAPHQESKRIKKVTFEEIQKEYSLTDGGWGDSSDDEM